MNAQAIQNLPVIEDQAAQMTQLAYHVIDQEASAIQQLKLQINQNFIQSCQLLYACTGHIIIMGVGKSGHIAQKIASTLASTGSPSFFIHPCEAQHGDIGMMTSQDILLVLSHSGETKEICALLPAIKQLGLPLISLTSQPQSTIAKAALFNINMGITQEACPLGLAPTSSSTAALAMGDTIAIVLLSQRKLTQNEFARLHPGGALGKQLLLRVNDIMHTGLNMPVVTEKTPLKEALIEITSKRLGMTTIINQQGQLIGTFTDGDLRRALNDKQNNYATPIHQLMSPNPKTILAQQLAIEALNIMEEFKITTLVILNPQHFPIGVVHIHDILASGIAPRQLN